MRDASARCVCRTLFSGCLLSGLSRELLGLCGCARHPVSPSSCAVRLGAATRQSSYLALPDLPVTVMFLHRWEVVRSPKFQITTASTCH